MSDMLRFGPTLSFKVSLTDKAPVLEHYQPPQGEEDACCAAYTEAIREQLMLDLGSLCPVMSRAGEVMNCMFPTVPPEEKIREIRDAMSRLKIPGITVEELTETAV